MSFNSLGFLLSSFFLHHTVTPLLKKKTLSVLSHSITLPLSFCRALPSPSSLTLASASRRSPSRAKPRAAAAQPLRVSPAPSTAQPAPPPAPRATSSHPALSPATNQRRLTAGPRLARPSQRTLSWSARAQPHSASSSSTAQPPSSLAFIAQAFVHGPATHLSLALPADPHRASLNLPDTVRLLFNSGELPPDPSSPNPTELHPPPALPVLVVSLSPSDPSETRPARWLSSNERTASPAPPPHVLKSARAMLAHATLLAHEFP